MSSNRDYYILLAAVLFVAAVMGGVNVTSALDQANDFIGDLPGQITATLRSGYHEPVTLPKLLTTDDLKNINSNQSPAFSVRSEVSSIAVEKDNATNTYVLKQLSMAGAPGGSGGGGITSESDPIAMPIINANLANWNLWLNDKSNYYTGIQTDSRIGQSNWSIPATNITNPPWTTQDQVNRTAQQSNWSIPATNITSPPWLLSFTESDPVWISDKPNYATKAYAQQSNYSIPTSNITGLSYLIAQSNWSVPAANITGATWATKQYVQQSNYSIPYGNITGIDFASKQYAQQSNYSIPYGNLTNVPTDFNNATALYTNQSLLGVQNNDTTQIKYTDARYKVVTVTHDISLTGDQAITGAEFKPAGAIVFSSTGVAAIGDTSYGMTDGTSNYCIVDSSTAGAEYVSTTMLIDLIGSAGVTESHAVIKSMDTDGMTITWSKQGSPTGTATLLIMFKR